MNENINKTKSQAKSDVKRERGLKVSTPCVKICKMQDEVCIGCGRTLEQISNWSSYSEEERAEIMKSLKATSGENVEYNNA